jgi:hypothetical protein
MAKYSYLSRGTFGWDATKLADAYTTAELVTATQAIEADPDSLNPAHATGKSIWLYTKAAMRKDDALTWAIYHRMQRERKEA